MEATRSPGILKGERRHNFSSKTLYLHKANNQTHQPERRLLARQLKAGCRMPCMRVAVLKRLLLNVKLSFSWASLWTIGHFCMIRCSKLLKVGIELPSGGRTALEGLLCPRQSCDTTKVALGRIP